MPTYKLIAQQTLTGSSASISFPSIPQTYTDLYMLVSARTDSTNTNSGSNQVDTCYVRFNNNLTNVSQTIFIEAVPNNTPTTSKTVAETVFRALGANTANADANTFANGYMWIPNYTNNVAKTIHWDFAGATTATSNSLRFSSGLFNNTTAISQIDIFPISGNFVSGSSFAIYGVARSDIAAKATGGNIITTDGTYWYHAFTGTGTLVPTSTISADVMVIAGGGGGFQGGGGAGGFRVLTSQSLAQGTTYTATVGAGGAGGGGSGNNSSFAGSGLTTITSTYGGYGGFNSNGVAGGSGGGAHVSNSSGAKTGGAGNLGGYTPVEGFAGGNNPNSSVNASAGGGGASAVGGSSSGSTSGNGGAGSNAYSSWGVATGLGQNVSGTYWFAGGGGGNSQFNTPGTGGNGGGGTGDKSPFVANVDALANTGGGGGAGYWSTYGAGGSGLVIVRYPV